MPPRLSATCICGNTRNARDDCQRNLPHVTPHGAAPAPVAAGLLTADAAFVAQHDGMGQEQRCAEADDATANDHHADALGNIWIRTDRIDRR